MADEPNPLTMVLRNNYRVVATVADLHIKKDHAARVRETRQLRAEIERHCDGYDDVDCHCDIKTVCRFCEEEWSGCADANGFPCCCNEAIKEAEKLGIKPEPEPDTSLHDAAPDLYEACKKVADECSALSPATYENVLAALLKAEGHGGR